MIYIVGKNVWLLDFKAPTLGIHLYNIQRTLDKVLTKYLLSYCCRLP